MRSLLRLAFGAACIVIAASALGLTVNALRPEGLPLIRKPLRETRRVATKEEVTSGSPIITQREQPIAATQPKPKPEDGKEQTGAKPPAPPNPTPAQPRPPKTQAVKPRPPQPVTNGHVKVEPQPKVEAIFTTLEDAKSYFDNKSALFVDSRPIEDYEAEHVAGAVWLYYEKLDELYDRVLGKTPKDRLIITYCSDPECVSAIKLADALVARGHTRVLILLEGVPGWKEKGYPIATGKEPGR